MNVDDILEIIDSYYKQYNLPEMNVTYGGWKALLDNLNKCFIDNDVCDLKIVVSVIIRRAINLALLDNCDTITLYYFIQALSDLKVFKISEEAIKELKFNIMLDNLKNNSIKENEKNIK